MFSTITSILWCRTNGWWCRCASGSSYATEWPPVETPLVSKCPFRFGNDLHGQKFGIFLLCLQEKYIKKRRIDFIRKELSFILDLLNIAIRNISNRMEIKIETLLKFNISDIVNIHFFLSCMCTACAQTHTIIQHPHFSLSFRFNNGQQLNWMVSYSIKTHQIIEWWKMKSLKS